MQTKKWLKTYLIVQFVLLFAIATLVVVLDPFLHYHEPLEMFYYTLDNQRSQNDGILKRFDYNAVVAGSSMIENFKTSEVDELFQVESIKLPYSGGSYKEVDDGIKAALEQSPDLKLVIRCLDMSRFYDDKDAMRTELGDYPEYLYNDNLFDDVEYVFNKDVILSRCMFMIFSWMTGTEGGITSFDEYSNWMENAEGVFGKEYVLGEREEYLEPKQENYLSEEERNKIEANIRQNVTETAKKNPEVEFYYFISPYSAVWWGDVYQEGNLEKQLEAERLIIELMLECENIKVYSFNNFTEITTNLDNYMDEAHYGEWINSEILEYMKDGVGLLTAKNYLGYLQEEYKFYSMFDYNSLFE